VAPDGPSSLLAQAARERAKQTAKSFFMAGLCPSR
jgi:hypothetical protein